MSRGDVKEITRLAGESFAAALSAELYSRIEDMEWVKEERGAAHGRETAGPSVAPVPRS
jgi:hypothetical protein